MVPVPDQPLRWEAAAWPLRSVPVTLRSTCVRDLSTSSSDSVSMNSDSSPAMKPQSTWLALPERSRAGPGPPHPGWLRPGQRLHRCGLKAPGSLNNTESARSELSGHQDGSCCLRCRRLVGTVVPSTVGDSVSSPDPSTPLYKTLHGQKKKSPHDGLEGTRRTMRTLVWLPGVNTPGSSVNTSHK